jgi:hypothetical protein
MWQAIKNWFASSWEAMEQASVHTVKWLDGDTDIY